MDGIQHKMCILREHEQQRPTRLLECDRDRTSAESAPQFRCPGVDSFRCVIEITVLDSSFNRGLQGPGMSLIYPVDPYQCNKVGLTSFVRIRHRKCSSRSLG